MYTYCSVKQLKQLHTYLKLKCGNREDHISTNSMNSFQLQINYQIVTNPGCVHNFCKNYERTLQQPVVEGEGRVEYDGRQQDVEEQVGREQQRIFIACFKHYQVIFLKRLAFIRCLTLTGSDNFL